MGRPDQEGFDSSCDWGGRQLAAVSSLPIIRPAGCFVTLAGITLLLEGRHRYGRTHFVHIVIGTIAFSFPGGFLNNWDYGAAYAFETQLVLWGLLSLIPAIMFAVAFYLAYSRIED